MRRESVSRENSVPTVSSVSEHVTGIACAILSASARKAVTRVCRTRVRSRRRPRALNVPSQASDRLYDGWAPGYDASYASASHRRAYDLQAAELVDALLPPAAAIVDVGCGTGRMARRWLAAGHRVTGIERAPGMIEMLRRAALPPGFTLVPGSMDVVEIPPGAADLVAALGSVQYAADPAACIARFAGWVRPGGVVCVYVDSLIALHGELMRAGRLDEAARMLTSRRGRLPTGDGGVAEFTLFTAATLRGALHAAGLVDIDVRGLVIGASFWGRDGVASRMRADEAAYLACEREFWCEPALADQGLHLFASGRRRPELQELR